MRILYFTRDYTPHDYRFLSALAKTEYKVYYLHLEQQAYPNEDRPVPSEIELVNWEGGGKPAQWQDGLRLLNSFKDVIRRVKPDIVQAGPIQRSAFLAALSGFRPLISMSWGYDLIRDAQRNSLWGWATRYTLEHSDVMVGLPFPLACRTDASSLFPGEWIWSISLHLRTTSREMPGTVQAWTIP
jgi:hypothetical protein